MSLIATSREVFELRNPKLSLPLGILEIWLTNSTLDFRLSSREDQLQGFTFLQAWKRRSMHEWSHDKTLGRSIFLQCHRKIYRNQVNRFRISAIHESWRAEIHFLSRSDGFLIGECLVYS